MTTKKNGFEAKIHLLMFFCTFLLAGNASAQLSFFDNNGERVELRLAGPETNLTQERGLFVKAFSETFENIQPSNLNPSFRNKEDVVQMLKDTFDNEERLFKNGQTYCVHAFQNEEPIGVVFFQQLSPQPYVNHLNAIYIREIAPETMDNPVSRELIFSALEVFPETDSLYVITRFINKKSVPFYEGLGFTETDYSRRVEGRPGYMNLEWHRENYFRSLNGTASP
jgi:hypothetical protein